ncbi:hypothetical protein SAMN04487913_109215 [Arthrobacter sp. ok362]|nr:hypothetical protein SAMN04487913_109215 [Arthrobacter sp. ok362]
MTRGFAGQLTSITAFWMSGRRSLPVARLCAVEGGPAPADFRASAGLAGGVTGREGCRRANAHRAGRRGVS